MTVTTPLTAWAGMDARTGRWLSGEAHLRQSVAKILHTALYTRLLRREFGAVLADLIDQPVNPLLIQRLRAGAVAALARWEPRIRVSRIDLSASDAADGWTLSIDYVRTGDGAPGSLAIARAELAAAS